jgi:prophage regulatory protein
MATATAVLRLPAVKARTGLSRSTIYHWVSLHKFPTPIRLGGKSIAWVESEIESWLSGCIKASRTPIISRDAV